MLSGLTLARLDDGRFEAPHVAGHGNGSTVFGGQLLAQMVAAACESVSPAPLTSLQAVFARPALFDRPLLIDVDVLHRGRNAVGATMTLHQGEAPCAGAVVLAIAPQSLDGVHSAAAPDVPGPQDSAPVPQRLHGVEIRLAAAPQDRPEKYLWMRAEGVDAGPRSKAMIAYCSESFFVETALQPVDGLSIEDAFKRFTPNVVAHGLAFHHDSPDASQWLLHALAAPHLSAGRGFGRGDVYTASGELVASITQEHILRPL